MSRFTVQSARAFLHAADVGSYFSDVESEIAEIKASYLTESAEWTPQEEADWRQEIKCFPQSLNMNDQFGWALAMGQHVPDDKLIEVATLFWQYGWNGLLYWTSEQ